MGSCEYIQQIPPLNYFVTITCVCFVRVDMIAIPGETSPSPLSAIIADEAALGDINRKTTAVSLISFPVKKQVMLSNLEDYQGELS